jgi:hypothetical protein
MKLELRIERLVIEGPALSLRERARLLEVIRGELIRRIDPTAASARPGDPSVDSARPRSRSSGASSTLGTRIAAAVYDALPADAARLQIARPGPSRPQTRTAS